MSGWVAKVWLPVDGIHFFFFRRKWVYRLEVYEFQQISTLTASSYSRKVFNMPVIKVDTICTKFK